MAPVYTPVQVQPKCRQSEQDFETWFERFYNTCQAYVVNDHQHVKSREGFRKGVCGWRAALSHDCRRGWNKVVTSARKRLTSCQIFYFYSHRCTCKLSQNENEVNRGCKSWTSECMDFAIFHEWLRLKRQPTRCRNATQVVMCSYIRRVYSVNSD